MKNLRMRGGRAKAVIVMGVLVMVLAIAAACGPGDPVPLEWQIAGGNLQWRYQGDSAWNNVAPIADLGSGGSEFDPTPINNRIDSINSTISGLEDQVQEAQDALDNVGSAGDGAAAKLSVRNNFIEWINSNPSENVITVSAFGFMAGETVRLELGDTFVVSAVANDTGGVSFGENVMIPSSFAPAGSDLDEIVAVPLRATGDTSGTVATGGVSVEDKINN